MSADFQMPWVSGAFTSTTDMQCNRVVAKWGLGCHSPETVLSSHVQSWLTYRVDNGSRFTCVHLLFLPFLKRMASHCPPFLNTTKAEPPAGPGYWLVFFLTFEKAFYCYKAGIYLFLDRKRDYGVGFLALACFISQPWMFAARSANLTEALS